MIGCAAALAGCECASEPVAIDSGARAEPEPVVVEPTAEDPTAEATAPTCTLGEPHAVALEGATLVAVAATEAGGLAVVSRSASELSSYALDASGAPSDAAYAWSVETPEGLAGLEAVGDRFLMIGSASCGSGERVSPCVHARALDARGAPLGRAAIVPLPSPVHTARTVVDGESVLVARSHVGSAPALDRFVIDGEGVRATTRALGEGVTLADDDRSVEILGLAATGGSWAVIFRHGAAESAESGVVLATQLDEHHVAPLHDALTIDSIAWTAGSLSLIASFEFMRPSYLRVGADGELRGEPSVIERGEPVPAPFGARAIAVLRADGPRTRVTVRDGAGDTLATLPLEAGDDFVAADVARVGDRRFLVAWIERDALVTRALDCSR